MCCEGRRERSRSGGLGRGEWAMNGCHQRAVTCWHCTRSGPWPRERSWGRSQLCRDTKGPRGSRRLWRRPRAASAPAQARGGGAATRGVVGGPTRGGGKRRTGQSGRAEGRTGGRDWEPGRMSARDGHKTGMSLAFVAGDLCGRRGDASGKSTLISGDPRRHVGVKWSPGTRQWAVEGGGQHPHGRFCV